MADAPNILLIWTDEQRADTMACYGNDWVETPHLNALAEDSCVFENAYCTQPVCTPSRTSILTGLYPHTHGSTTNNVRLSDDCPTIAEMLPEAYDTAYFGKWHLGDEISAQRGFRDWLSIEDGMYRPFYSDPAMLERVSDYHHFLVDQGFAPDCKAGDGAAVFSRGFAAALAEQYTKAAFLGRESARYLRERDTDSPLLMSVNFLEPHMPFFGPLNDRYDPATLPVGPAFNVPPADDSARYSRLLAAHYSRHGHGGYPLQSEADWRRLRANYFGLVTMVDNAVGTILAALEESGQADNTVIVYTSDHGDMMGDHGILAKCCMYEESVRIPLLVKAPGAAGHTAGGCVSQVDLVPTLLDLAGVEAPAHLQGCSRASVVTGAETLADNDVVVEWNGGINLVRMPPPGFSEQDVQQAAAQSWRTLVTADGWKLNRSAVDTTELFDLTNDPHELQNLAAVPAQAPRVEALTARLRDWQAATGDTAAIA
jgi:arylsulfatase A-like enzyme